MKSSLLCLLFLACVSAIAASAQETTTGTIFGRVTDEQGGVIPGASITIHSEMGTKHVVSDESGRFLVPYLTPGLYSASVELTGFSPIRQERVDVRLGQRTELVFTLKVGSITEALTVTEAAPVVDVTSTTAGATVDSDLLEKIPVGRQLADVLYIVPGVSPGGGSGHSNPSMAGGAGLDNQYYIDGVNVTDNGYGSLGVWSVRYGPLGQGVTYEFIDEIQVKTGGYEAEYGQSTGGVVNVITKSGSNLLRGSVFGYVEPADLRSESKNFDSGESWVEKTGEAQKDLGFTLGGPIVQDRAFFFAALHPQWNTSTFLAPEGYPLRDLGEVDDTSRFLSYAAKATFHVSPNHRLDASFFGDPATSDDDTKGGGALLADTTAHFSRLEFGSDQQVVKYQGLATESWFLEASFARAASTFEETPSVDEWRVTDLTVRPVAFRGGLGTYESTDSQNFQYRVQSTHLLGTHQLRYGVSFEDIHYDEAKQATGPSFTLPDGTQTPTGAIVSVRPDPVFGRIYRVSAPVITNILPTTQRYLSFFLQDKFDVGDHLTLSAGIRYEQQKLAGDAADFTWDDNWAPRIGAVFDPTGMGRAKIFASYGRYFAKLPNLMALWSLNDDPNGQADYFDEALTMPVPDGVFAGGSFVHYHLWFGGPFEFDPNAKSSLLDEVLAGFELEALRGLSLGVRYIWRELGRVLEDVGTASLTLFFTDPERFFEEQEYYITNIGPDIATVGGQGAFEKPIRNYQAIEVTTDKRFSDQWALFASYRYSRLWGNFEGFFRNEGGAGAAPGQTPLFDFPTDDPTYAELAPEFGFRGDIRFQGEAGAGPLPNDRTHQVKLYATYAFDKGLGLGVGFFASSGKPLTPLAANPVYQFAEEIPEAPRGSGIQTVNGFKKRADFQTELDLHVDYRIPIGDRSQLTLVGDLFNVLNQQTVLGYDQATEYGIQVPNPDFGTPGPYADPLRARFGVRFEF